jgi:hypothetical protein
MNYLNESSTHPYEIGTIIISILRKETKVSSNRRDTQLINDEFENGTQDQLQNSPS